MSGYDFLFSVPGLSLSAGVAKSAIRIRAGTNHRVLVHMIMVFFNGTSPEDDPIKVDWMKSSNAGVFNNLPTGGSALKINLDLSEGLQASVAYNGTTEPTSPTVLKSWQAHPQGGIATILPIDRPLVLPGGGDYHFLRCNAPQAVSVIVNLWCEE